MANSHVSQKFATELAAEQAVSMQHVSLAERDRNDDDFAQRNRKDDFAQRDHNEYHFS